jgi:hypothetical protein
MSQFMNQPEKQSGKTLRRIISSVLFVAMMFVASTDYSQATQQAKPQSQENVHSVVAKQAALVSEFEVNGLKVLLKRRPTFRARKCGASCRAWAR